MRPPPGNILVVDDQPDDLSLLVSLLSERGYTVRPTLDGSTALAAALAAPPDLILLDVQMPRLDGYATCRLLKAHAATAAVPVMFISASHELFDKVQAFAAGGVDYISKPYEAAEVIARVETQLRLAQMQQNLEEQNRRLHEEITERRRIEAELQRQHEQLEDLVAARTASLTTALIDLEHTMAERTRVEEALYLTRFSVERIADALYWLDSTGRIIDVNAGACRMLGYERDELLALTVFDIDPALSLTTWHEQRQRLQHSGSFSIETVHRARSGALIPVELITNWIVYGDHELECAIVRDISERKRAEEARRAQEQAEAANQAKSAFLANISHELRTPLNGILGYAQLLKEETRDKTIVDGLNIIQYSGEHLLTLINDLLDLAKIEAGKLELTLVEARLADFLARVVDMVRSRAETKRLQLTIDLPDTLPAIIKLDQKCLRQVLLNLLGNAVKFTDRGRVTLAVEELERIQAPDEPPQSRLRFTVRDTGIGIAPDQLKRIFEPFVQIGAGDKYSSGTGLGLTISRQLITILGGQLMVQSAPGEGSVFWFDLILPTGAEAVWPQAPAKTTRLAEIDLPPRAELEKIYRQAQQCNLLALYAQAKTLAARERRYIFFAQQITDLALASEYEELCAWLSPYLSTEPHTGSVFSA